MSRHAQLSLFDDVPDAATLLAKPEGQYFDRKSFRTEPKALGDAMLGFANADGGRVVVGIHNGRIEGVDGDEKRLNGLLQAAIDCTAPPVRHSHQFVACEDSESQQNRLLVLDIEASETIHRNKKGECFLRVGDENRRLADREERELAFDKGESIFDKSIVRDVDLDDLDLAQILLYAQRLKVTDWRKLLGARGLYVARPDREGVTQAGWLLLGKEPPIWSYVRYLKFSGVRIETGVRSNVTDDVMLSGTLPSLIEQTRALLTERLGTAIRLGRSGQFERIPLLPEFAWLEAVVNALTHRSYSIHGDGIKVRDFDDRIEIESPGRLPGLVRVKNIRTTRFSRNPHIARVLSELTGYVRELNEGVGRIYDEMSLHGLREPRFEASDSSVKVTLYKHPDEESQERQRKVSATLDRIRLSIDEEGLKILLNRLHAEGSLRPKAISDIIGASLPTVRKYMGWLEEVGLVEQSASSSTDPKRLWRATQSPLWERLVEEGNASEFFK